MKLKNYVGVIVKFNDAVLLCLRGEGGSLPGIWSVPMGKAKKGESLLEAAEREFYEETNIDIGGNYLEFVGTFERKTRKRKKVKGIVTIFLLEVNEMLQPDLENAIDGHEHTNWNYFTLDEIEPKDTGEELYELLKKVLE